MFNDAVILILFLVGYLFLMKVVLPKLGVST